MSTAARDRPDIDQVDRPRYSMSGNAVSAPIPASNASQDSNAHNNDDIIMPSTPAEREILVQRLRLEILQGWLNDELARLGVRGPISAYDYDLAQIIAAAQGNRYIGNLPFITSDNIVRHDWTRRADCNYLIVFSGRRIHGPAETLVNQVCGLRRALWQYWEKRPRVRDSICSLTVGIPPISFTSISLVSFSSSG